MIYESNICDLNQLSYIIDNLSANYTFLHYNTYNLKPWEVYAIGAKQVLQSVLAIARNIDVDCLPGNERERIQELELYCMSVSLLWTESSIDRDTVVEKCHEALSQLYYLVELQSIPLAIILQAVCPV